MGILYSAHKCEIPVQCLEYEQCVYLSVACFPFRKDRYRAWMRICFGCQGTHYAKWVTLDWRLSLKINRPHRVFERIRWENFTSDALSDRPSNLWIKLSLLIKSCSHCQEHNSDAHYGRLFPRSAMLGAGCNII